MNLQMLIYTFLIFFTNISCYSNEMHMKEQERSETAVFGGGCFWCTEAVFEGLKGVIFVESGYSGGKLKNPTYQEVCSGLTGHAEVVRITYNPEKVSYEFLLSVFFQTHDPTTMNAQGNDRGTQYRSVIFYNSEQQKQIASSVISKLNSEKVYEKPVVTELSPLGEFYKAEDYHQDYFAKNPEQGYCQFVVKPKVEKFRKVFKEYLK
jgi:peptide-methionine (S)-S-oxide reductase